ncbi:hypothetical protein CC79DRAFT_1337856 [Sarocladium strictum]
MDGHSAPQRHTRQSPALHYRHLQKVWSRSLACVPRLPAGYVLPSLAHVSLLVFLGLLATDACVAIGPASPVPGRVTRFLANSSH